VDQMHSLPVAARRLDVEASDWLCIRATLTRSAAGTIGGPHHSCRAEVVLSVAP
jgi:hypothetical protein